MVVKHLKVFLLYKIDVYRHCHLLLGHQTVFNLFYKDFVDINKELTQKLFEGLSFEFSATQLLFKYLPFARVEIQMSMSG